MTKEKETSIKDFESAIAELEKIVDLLAEEVRERLSDRNVDFELTEAAKAALVDEGYDPAFGARPLRRTVQRRVENELAKRMLAGEFHDGQCVVALAGVEHGYWLRSRLQALAAGSGRWSLAPRLGQPASEPS